jgi:hypothetical protein
MEIRNSSIPQLSPFSVLMTSVSKPTSLDQGRPEGRDTRQGVIRQPVSDTGGVISSPAKTRIGFRMRIG